MGFGRGEDGVERLARRVGGRDAKGVQWSGGAGMEESLSLSSATIRVRGLGQAVLTLFALLFPLVTARGYFGHNHAVFLLLGLLAMPLSVLVLLELAGKPIRWQPWKVALSVGGVAALAAALFLQYRTAGATIALPLVASSGAAILLLALHPTLLREAGGRFLAIGLLAWVALIFASAVLSEYPRFSLRGDPFRLTGLAAAFGCVVIFTAVILFVDRREILRRIFGGLFVAAALTSLVGMIQFFEPSGAFRIWFNEVLWEKRPMGTFGHPNWFGTFLCLMLPLSAGWWFGAHGKAGRIAAGLLSGLLFAALLICQTRGAWVGFAAFGGWMIWTQRRQRKLLLLLIGIWFVVAAGLLPAKDGQVWRRLLSLEREATYAMEAAPRAGTGRFGFWSYALRHIPDHALLGSGFDTYMQVQQPGDTVPVLNKAHSLYLEYALTTGIPALLLYLAILWLCFAPPRAGPGSMMGWAFRGSLLAYLVQGIFIHDVIHTWPLVWLLAGLSVVQARLDRTKNEPATAE